MCARQGRAGGDQGTLHAADPPPVKLPGKFLVLGEEDTFLCTCCILFQSLKNSYSEQSLICFYCSFRFLKCNLPLSFMFGFLHILETNGMVLPEILIEL